MLMTATMNEQLIAHSYDNGQLHVGHHQLEEGPSPICESIMSQCVGLQDFTAGADQHRMYLLCNPNSMLIERSTCRLCCHNRIVNIKCCHQGYELKSVLDQTVHMYLFDNRVCYSTFLFLI